MSTRQFVARRIIGLLVVLVVSSLLVYGSLYLTPGGPLSFLVGNRSASPEVIASITAQYHLDDPFVVRYFAWMGDVLHGDLGRSLVYREAVTDLIASRLLTTFLLVSYATALIIVVGVGAGVVSAIRGGWAGRLVSTGSILFLATPAFVLGVVLILVFANGLGWFPVFGPGEGVLGRLWHLTLPAIALAMASAAYLARITRSAMVGELGREHVETAVSRGISRRSIIRRHVMRNASIPIVTVIGLTIGGLVAASVVVENVFALDGLGSLLVRAILQRDFAVVQAVVLLLVIVFVVVNLIVDLLYTVLDPRLSLGGDS